MAMPDPLAGKHNLLAVHDIITARNQKESPLLRLPAELRNLIWNYAFAPESSPGHAGMLKARVLVPGDHVRQILGTTTA
ncbi:hypothetical protein E8E13_002862 [Curvularia kusanoi]|uniref:Uncharacterized protein n=1 Tax=Curvularia kusanoi TaxID=90978 RepID=A0A9P4TBL6_CURKU|nr:hypothetical protein E8E13_002862 [Curvularia kusanoi]